ncbi:MAG: ribosome silencing factor [Prevotellaceae bacterium]|jgi:ribosome-associated protein|nr:ribosome silencing factor [Prevotellaceae bacterium]
MTKDEKTLIQTIVEGMQEKKAKRIVTVDMSELQAPCCYFVICEGDSSTHVDAIADSVRQYVHTHAKQKPFAIDGYENSVWIALDYGVAIVHIFRRETREFYDIEHLWNDAHITQIQDIN